MRSEASKKKIKEYKKKYYKKNYRTFSIKLSKKSDADVIGYLEEQSNTAEWLRQQVREHNEENAKRKFRENDTKKAKENGIEMYVRSAIEDICNNDPFIFFNKMDTIPCEFYNSERNRYSIPVTSLIGAILIPFLPSECDFMIESFENLKNYFTDEEVKEYNNKQLSELGNSYKNALEVNKLFR